MARKGNADAKGRSRRSDVAMDRMRAEEARPHCGRRHCGARGAPPEGGRKRGVGMVAPHRRARRIRADRAAAGGLSRRDAATPRAKRARSASAMLRGALEVTDDERFLARVLAGFGRAKAFGCGLMLLRRAP